MPVNNVADITRRYRLWQVLLSPLVQKLVFVTIVPILAGLVLLATLMFFQYQQIIRSTVEQRYILFAGEIKSQSEPWLQSGVLPEDIPNIQGILGSISENAGEAFSIDIINKEGVIIHSLDPSRLRERLSVSILRNFNGFMDELQAGRQEQPHLIYDAYEQRVVMVPLFDNFGWSAATLVSFPQSAYLQIIDGTIYRVIYYFIVIAIGITLISLVAGALLLRSSVQWLWYLNDRLGYLGEVGDNRDYADLSIFETELTENLRQMETSADKIYKIDIAHEMSGNKSKKAKKTHTARAAKKTTSARSRKRDGS